MKQKSVLITGGTSGIGLAAARIFLEHNYRVMISGRSEERGREALAYLRRTIAGPVGKWDKGAADGASGLAAEDSGLLFFKKCDVRSAAEVKDLVRETLLRFDGIDILVNSAGIYLEKRLEETTEQEWDALIGADLKGVFLCCKEVYPYFKKAGKGVIVNVSSDDGLKGEPSCAAYCAAKGGVSNLTRALALDWSAEGIRVNAVCPGVIDTPLTEAVVAEQEDRERYTREMEALHPIGRIGRPEEAAAAIFFLASEEASFITGANLAVDGGSTAG
jgi:NAD(P)-dependent dehydrogenase (short-subunit alcohol dehydrogenase family)